MVRLVFTAIVLFALSSCQSLFEGNKGQEELKKRNYVLKRGHFPDRLIESELKPFLLSHYGSDSFAPGEDKLFQRLRRLELVQSLSEEGIVASCDSYEILSRDKIEDNLYQSSKKWYELRLLKNQFESAGRLNPKISQMISRCLEGDIGDGKKESFLTSLE